MKKIFMAGIYLTIFSGMAVANNISEDDLEAIKKNNSSQMTQAMEAYKKSQPSSLNLGNLPKPLIDINGSFNQRTKNFSLSADKIDPLKPIESKMKLFISFSMNDESIKKYVQEAHRIGRDNISLSLIGLKNGTSMRETSAYIGKLTKGYNVSVEIDPPAFERFDIKTVPALVVYHDDPIYEAMCATGVQPEKDSKVLEKWIGTAGDVSIAYSIEHLLEAPSNEFKGYLSKVLDNLRGSSL